MELAWTEVSPSVDFTNASTTFLADDPANWPPRFTIPGFTYDRFELPRGVTGRPAWDHAARSAWLSRQAVYDAGPYEQAARVFREHGYASAAESILIAQRDQARQLIGGRGAGVRRALDGVFGLTVAYGYRPGRVLWLLAALLILVLASLELPAAQATLRATSGGPARVARPAVHLVPGPAHPGRPGHGMVAERRVPTGLAAVDDLCPVPGPAGPCVLTAAALGGIAAPDGRCTRDHRAVEGACTDVLAEDWLGRNYLTKVREMDEAMVRQVRSFNRTVTQRIGVLSDGFLARERPLGQARLLWEIGPDGCDVRQLRSRLDLDSGYLSRLLRALESDGLAMVEPSGADGRVRSVRLTAAGLAERAVLDERSDAAAALILSRLNPRQRARLAAAMAETEPLLTASAVELAERDPVHPDAQSCLRAYFGEIAGRFDGGFDPARSPVREEQLTPPAGLFLVATLHGEPVGCGGIKFPAGAPAYIKRMWVCPAVRGLGVGRRLLAELEGGAAARRLPAIQLETNRALPEAIALYRSAGYREVPPFNDEPYAHHWFEKSLGPPSAAISQPRA